MIDFEIKPFSGEDEISALKRKVYFLREVKYRIEYQEEQIKCKSVNTVPLTSSEKGEIDAFWDKYLPRSLKDAFWDYRFYEFYKTVRKSNERLCDYLPDMFYEAFIDEFYTDPQHTRSFDDKNLYDVYFYDVNKPATVFRKVGNQFMDASYKPISQKQAIRMAQDCGEVILKVAKYSVGGKGVMFWNAHKDSIDSLSFFLTEKANVICQTIIKQHHELNRLNATSVNTVRILTLLFQGKVHVLSGVLRMGVNGARVDNASSGGIVCGIMPDGQLKGEAFDTSGNRYSKHPQGTDFETVSIPNFNLCLDLAISLAERFSMMSRLISWDFAIGEDGYPVLIEFNLSHGQLDFHQLCNGPIFGDLTDDDRCVQ